MALFIAMRRPVVPAAFKQLSLFVTTVAHGQAVTLRAERVPRRIVGSSHPMSPAQDLPGGK